LAVFAAKRPYEEQGQKSSFDDPFAPRSMESFTVASRTSHDVNSPGPKFQLQNNPPTKKLLRLSRFEHMAPVAQSLVHAQTRLYGLASGPVIKALLHTVAVQNGTDWVLVPAYLVLEGVNLLAAQGINMGG
jgi:hypothetical protein